MTELDYKWLQANPHIWLNVRLSQEEMMMMILIYNRITGKNQKMTGCARCISNMKKRLLAEYDRYESL